MIRYLGAAQKRYVRQKKTYPARIYEECPRRLPGTALRLALRSYRSRAIIKFENNTDHFRDKTAENADAADAGSRLIPGTC
ncbi:MAG: hypothetical protein OIN66_06150 [Candidatus Methanoperedens sp.]|nr:hypothetical protein [Candidatus Methanoperedens sp.]